MALVFSVNRHFFQAISYCSPNQTKCHQKYVGDTFDCMVPCQGLFADVQYVQEDPRKYDIEKQKAEMGPLGKDRLSLLTIIQLLLLSLQSSENASEISDIGC